MSKCVDWSAGRDQRLVGRRAQTAVIRVSGTFPFLVVYFLWLSLIANNIHNRCWRIRPSSSAMSQRPAWTPSPPKGLFKCWKVSSAFFLSVQSVVIINKVSLIRFNPTGENGGVHHPSAFIWNIRSFWPSCFAGWRSNCLSGIFYWCPCLLWKVIAFLINSYSGKTNG